MTDASRKISRMEWVMRLDDQLRAKEPWRFPPRNPDIFTIEEVAGYLYCSVDQARRIPRDLLCPKSGPGKRAIYLREDVKRYADGLPDRAGRKFAQIRGTTSRKQALPPFDPAEELDLDKAIRRVGKRRGST